jgi:hypothetical protein
MQAWKPFVYDTQSVGLMIENSISLKEREREREDSDEGSRDDCTL